MRGHFGDLVFGTTIPRNVRIAEAPSHGLPVLIYDNACAGAQAYILLASEFIRRRREAGAAHIQRCRMSHPPKPRGLGRGLSALSGDEEVAATVARHLRSRHRPHPVAVPASSRPPLILPIAQLRPGRMQPRTTFDGLEALVNSVRTFGLLQPHPGAAATAEAGGYEIVAGERRWRAAQQAQLHEVPVVVRSIGDQDALQLGLVENLQRADLTAIDEAHGYRRLIGDFGQTQEEIAKTVGKSRPHVANTMRLLELPGACRRWCAQASFRPDRRAR